MLILFGKKLLETKSVPYALTKVFGIGITSAKFICNILNIPKTLKIIELTEIQQLAISAYIKQNYIVEMKLKHKIQKNIQNLMDINSVKGFRHRCKLPVRGQRTHSNAKTCKRKVV